MQTLLYLMDRLGVGRDGGIVLPLKTLGGLREFLRRWEGNLLFGTLGGVQEFEPGDPTVTADWEQVPGLRCVGRLRSPREVAEIEADLVLAGVTHAGVASLQGADLPLVLLDDNSVGVRLRIARIETPSSTDFARYALGHLRDRITVLSPMAREARGIQANGFAAHHTYRRLNRNTLLYLDHRIDRTDVDAVAPRAREPGQPLRLGFSGRLVALKGVRHLPHISRWLDQMGVPHSLTILGTGPELGALRDGAPPHVRFLGHLDFEGQWKHWVRENLDVMVLPHIQGDSSSTYYEALGSGVPVVAFANATSRPLAEASGAVAVVRRTRGAKGLAMAIAGLAADARRWSDMRTSGLAFMAAHTVEHEFDRRVDHLRGCL
ncbi:hypothetical protein TESS_TESS_00663 [Tessaracoccus sp. O5.2]|uniref:glycosyltransferase n=1 Tax=Tessaracoccus sp. O5.2 TaxID=3157622 RepID=UPI0035E57F3B